MHILMMTQRVDRTHDILGFTVDWVERLANRVDTVSVLTAYEGSHDLPPNVRVRSFGKERGFSKPRRVFEFERYCRRFRSEGVDAVFVHMIPQYVLASWPWLGRDHPYLMWYAHSSVGWDTRLAHALVDEVVTPTPSSFRIDTSKVTVVGHGIDMERFAPGDPATDRSLLLSVGRVSPVKNTHILVEAIGMLRDRDVDATLRIIAGESRSDPEYIKRVRSRIADKDLQEAVEFVGSVPHEEIVTEYRRAGAFLNASQTGSLDKTEVEAMACETPTISCNDSFVEMVQSTDLDASRLTFEADQPGELADRVEDLVTLDGEEYRHTCRECRSVVSARHDVDTLMDSIAERLRSLVEMG